MASAETEAAAGATGGGKEPGEKGVEGGAVEETKTLVEGIKNYQVCPSSQEESKAA